MQTQQVEGNATHTARVGQAQIAPLTPGQRSTMSEEDLVGHFLVVFAQLTAPNLEALRRHPVGEPIAKAMDARLKYNARLSEVAGKISERLEADEALRDTDALPGLTWGEIEHALGYPGALDECVRMLGVLGGLVILREPAGEAA